MKSVLIIVLIIFLLVLPFLPIRIPFTFCFYQHTKKNRYKNWIFMVLSFVTGIAVIVFMPYVLDLTNLIEETKIWEMIMKYIPGHALYSAALIKTILINLLYLTAVLVIMAIVGGFVAIGSLFSSLFTWLRKKRANRSERKQKTKKTDEKSKCKDKDMLPNHLLPVPEEMSASNREFLSEEKLVVGVTEEDEKEAEEAEPPFLNFLQKFFYETTEDGGCNARPQGFHVSSHLYYFLLIMGGIYVVAFILLLIPVFFASNVLPDWFYRGMTRLVDWCYLYPTVSMVFLLEVYFFLHGAIHKKVRRQKKEIRKSRTKEIVIGLDELETKTYIECGDGYEITKVMTKALADTMMHPAGPDLPETFRIQSLKLFLKDRNIEINNEFVHGIAALQDGDSALFDMPLNTAVDPYLFFYMNSLLVKGERIVVVCTDEQEADVCNRFIRRGFDAVIPFDRSVWNVRNSREMNRELMPDVLLMTADDFQKENLLHDGTGFFRNVRLILVPSADRMILSDNYQCLIVAENVKKRMRQDVQYLFLARRHIQNLNNSLYQFFNLEKEVYYVHGDYAFGEDVRVYIWCAGVDLKVRLDNTARKKALEENISEVAASLGIHNVTIDTRTATSRPQKEKEDLEVLDKQSRGIRFTIVEDDEYNLPAVLYTYSRYMGKNVHILHIISHPYLMRDYYLDNAVKYFYEVPLVNHTMAEHADYVKSEMMILLCRLTLGMKVQAFASSMKRVDGQDQITDVSLDYELLSRMVADCLNKALETDEFGEKYNRFQLDFQQRDGYETDCIIRIHEEKILERMRECTSLVHVHFTGQREEVQLDLFKRMLGQRYLVGQNLVYNHRNYEIRNIDYVQGIIHVDDANNSRSIPQDYIQIREYRIEKADWFQTICNACVMGNAFEEKEGVESSRIRVLGEKSSVETITMVHAQNQLEIHSDTVSYYMIRTDASRIDFANNVIQEKKLTAAEKAPLERTVGSALYVSLQGDFKSHDRLAFTFAMLLQEFMKTLFCNQHFCISVCPLLEYPDQFYENDDKLNRTIARMYPYLAGWDKKYNKNLEFVIVDDCIGGTGVLNVLFEKEATFIQNVFSMLYDYLLWQEDNEENCYYYFGSAIEPEIYDVRGVRHVLKGFEQHYQRESSKYTQLADQNNCVFCGKTISIARYEVGDWQAYMCEDCSKEYSPDENETNLIFKYILAYAEKYMNSTLKADVKVRLGGSDVLGEGQFYLFDQEAGEVILAEDLPLTAVHMELMKAFVEIWQIENLTMQGSSEMEGQKYLVALQYLLFLKQYQRVQRLQSQSVLRNTRDFRGFRRLRESLQKQGQKDSFRLLREKDKQSKKQSLQIPKLGKPRRKKGELHYFYYEKLTGAARDAYDRLLKAIMDMETSVSLEDLKIPKKQAVQIIEMIENEHAEIFWKSRQYSYTSDSPGEIKEVQFAYWMDKTEREHFEAEIEKEVSDYLDQISEEMNDYEAALKIYELMIGRMDYDSISLQEQEENGLGDQPDELRSVYGALVNRKAVCAGYAKGYLYLLHQLGIECLYVTGDCIDRGRHAWNIVKLYGKYYHVDVTWGDHSNTDASKSSEDISYSYFGLSDSLIRRTRSIERHLNPPRCTSEDCNYYVQTGLYFEEYDFGAIKDAVIRYSKDNHEIPLRFSTRKLLSYAKEHLIEKGEFRSILKSGDMDANAAFYHMTDETMYVLKFTI